MLDDFLASVLCVAIIAAVLALAGDLRPTPRAAAPAPERVATSR